MGIAENLKKTLISADTTTSPNRGVQNFPKKSPQWTTSAITVIPEIPPERVDNKLNSLIVNTAKKIKNTPYWSEYSKEDQERMICRYFDIKIKSEKYSDVKITPKEKLSFIEDVLTIVKNH